MIKRHLSGGRTVAARTNNGIRKRCGCPRSSWTRCPHPWHGNVSHAGREHRVSLHKWAKQPADYVMLQGEAKTVYRQWCAAVTDGNAPTPKANGLTFDALVTIYLAEHVHHPDRRPGAVAEMARQVETLRAAFGAHIAAVITKPMIETFRQVRRQAHEADKAAITELAALRAADPKVEIPADLVRRAQRAQISTKSGRVATNRLFSRLSHMFAWAIAEKGLLDASPFAKGGVAVIKKDRKAESGRTRRLEGDEETRLLTAAGPHLHACIVAILETGMRRSEILGLQWQDVRSALGVINLPASLTKTGISRPVIITPNLAATLDMRAAAQRATLELGADDELPATAHPFGNEIGERVKGFKTAWMLTCRRAGVTGLRFHDLRRESGSRLLEAPGVSVTDVRDFLGHRDVTQTNTYLASTALRLRDAVAKRDAARTNLAHTAMTPDQLATAPALTH